MIRPIRLIRNSFCRVLIRCGGYPRLKSIDRKYLETVIFPHFAKDHHYQDILFIGCEWYTKIYETFFIEKNYTTLDADPKKKIFGSKKHICDLAEHVNQYYANNSLDLIICNGVFGWGLNDLHSIEKTFTNFFNCLRQKGVFLLGWNDIAEHRPLLPEDTSSITLFKPYHFPLTMQWRHRIASRNSHVYDFYYKA